MKIYWKKKNGAAKQARIMTHNYLGHFRIFRYNDFYEAAVSKFLNFSTLNSYKTSMKNVAQNFFMASKKRMVKVLQIYQQHIVKPRI